MTLSLALLPQNLSPSRNYAVKKPPMLSLSYARWTEDGAWIGISPQCFGMSIMHISCKMLTSSPQSHGGRSQGSLRSNKRSLDDRPSKG
ncbi:hypothetical protein QQF64_013562 [Cirrhinus molitorella]|uniref:Uncharacterized protein n=1 Tax=Cirrhinus molitorella TaxID=172907 RepID=A0ABR3LRI6_9TELE